MKCKKCKHDLFKIEIKSTCSDCKYNGAFDDEHDLIYDKEEIKIQGLTRSEVEEDVECELGPAWGIGCYTFICAGCGDETTLALIDS